MLKQYYRLAYLLSLTFVVMLSLGLSGCRGTSDNTEPGVAGEPIVTLVARPTGTEIAPGQQVAIAAEVVSSSKIQSIRWTAKDGGELSVDEGQSVIYKVPDTPGKYNVDVLVTNEDGSTTDTVTFEVPTPAVAIVEPNSGQPEEVAAVSVEEPTPTDISKPTATPTKEPDSAPTEPPSSDTPTATSPPASSDAVAKAIRIDTPPEIDGHLNDQVWTQAEPLTYAEHPSANDSTTVVARLLWDDQYLYAGFDVSDTQVERSSTADPWNGDSVSVIIDIGGQIREYRHSLIAEDRADRKGDAESRHFLKGTTSFDDPTNSDEGYSVEMQIPWGTTSPVVDSKISADFLSVDHDQNPGGTYDAADTFFSKISWDGDGSVDTAGRSILLSTSPVDFAGKVCKIEEGWDYHTIFLRQLEFDTLELPIGTEVTVTILDTGKSVEGMKLGLDSTVETCSVRMAEWIRMLLGVNSDTNIFPVSKRPDRQFDISLTLPTPEISQTITITEPERKVECPKGIGCDFIIKGTSTGITPNSTYQIVPFINPWPDDPDSWFPQPDRPSGSQINRNGTWQAEVRIGDDKGEEPDHHFGVVVLVMDASAQMPREFQPLPTAIAQSNIVNLVTVGSKITGKKCPFDDIPFRSPISDPPTNLVASIDSIPHCADNLPGGTATKVSGSYSGDFEDKELWILVYASDTNYYPQSANACAGQTAQLLDNGQWVETLWLGKKGVPEAFHIVTVATDIGSAASETFHQYLANGCAENWGSVPLIPPGATELDSIVVHTG